MEACGLSGRGAQAKMMELTGWSKATMSQLYNGTQDYSPKVVNEAASALNVQPFELLMLPEKAMAFRKVQASAQEIATIAHDADMGPAVGDIAAIQERRESQRSERTGTHG